MIQLCLDLKIPNCWLRLSLVSLGVKNRIAASVTTTATTTMMKVFNRSGNPPHGTINRMTPVAVPIMPSRVSHRYFATATGVDPILWKGRLFMYKKARITNKSRIGTQTRPAFWIQMSVVAPSAEYSYGSPLRGPNKRKVITQGIRNCITLTPRFPNPAFSPSASPCSFFGKKKLMFDMDEANAPPPTPDSAASMMKR